MNKLFSALLVTGLFCFAAHADLMEYTFDGRITFTSNSSYAQPNNLVHYVFQVDTDLPGILSYSNGSEYTYTDFSNSYSARDYFQTDLVSGMILPDFHANDAYEFHNGLTIDYTSGSDFSEIRGGESEHSVRINSYNSTFNNWAVGNVFSAQELTRTLPSYTAHYYDATVTLTSITPVSASVPEPASVSLFFAGLLGLGGLGFFRRRK